MCYGLDDRSSILGRGKDFSLFHCVQIGSGNQPTLYLTNTGDSFEWVKRPGRESDHSPLFNAEVEKAWSYTSAPSYSSIPWCLIKHRGNFTFSFYGDIMVLTPCLLQFLQNHITCIFILNLTYILVI